MCKCAKGAPDIYLGHFIPRL